MKNYASFAEWKADQSAENQLLISKLQGLIEQTAPQLTTTVKWGQGCWVDGDSPKVFIHAEDDHIQLGFYSGSSLNDPHQLLSGNGKYVRFVKVYSEQDIDPKSYRLLIEQSTATS